MTTNETELAGDTSIILGLSGEKTESYKRGRLYPRRVSIYLVSKGVISPPQVVPNEIFYMGLSSE